LNAEVEPALALKGYGAASMRHWKKFACVGRKAQGARIEINAILFSTLNLEP
jgi:hypothetical protein